MANDQCNGKCYFVHAVVAVNSERDKSKEIESERGMKSEKLQNRTQDNVMFARY